MRKQRRHNEDETEVDMTPMLDIVFIMLIFFIVTTSFVKESGIILDRPAASPPTDAQNDNPSRPILIEIDDSNTIRMAGRVVDTNAIRANVETARAKSPKSLVIVRAHPLATTGIVVSAVDQSRLAGADKVTVVKPAL